MGGRPQPARAFSILLDTKGRCQVITPAGRAPVGAGAVRQAGGGASLGGCRHLLLARRLGQALAVVKQAAHLAGGGVKVEQPLRRVPRVGACTAGVWAVGVQGQLSWRQ